MRFLFKKAKVTFDGNGDMNDKIYNVGNRITNTYIYGVPSGFVMVDTGYEHSLASVCHCLEKQGIVFHP